jgi:hypothetical protein
LSIKEQHYVEISYSVFAEDIEHDEFNLVEDFKYPLLFATPYEQKTDITYEEDIKQEVISSKKNPQLYSDLQKVVYDSHTSKVEVNIG